MRHRVPSSTLLALALLAVILAAPASAQFTFVDVNPNQSDTDASDPDGASGGRVNGLAIEAGNSSVMYAASEWGGLYKTTDAGLTWGRLDGHLPVAMWDVEVDPGTPSRVYASSFYDGKAASVSGINVSNDAGTTWTHPASAKPPVGFCQNAADEVELTAFGISIHPANNAIVYIGTSCGLAKSTDSGLTWSYIDPTPGAGTASRIWDVIALPGGIVHVCGDDGHLRSNNGGATWVASTGLPSGRCSLAISPDESYVLFAAVGTSIYETDNGNAVAGATWASTRQNLSPQGRIPFVETNQRSNVAADNVFDLWFGDVSLYRVSCTTPAAPAPGGSPRCGTGNIPPWLGPFTRTTGAHDDTGALLFDSEAAIDACPVLLSSDGGVFYNTDTTPDCHNPNWEQPNVTPHGLWPFTMSGVDRAGVSEDLYFGNQDNGLYGTIDISSLAPTWHNEICCDGFDTAGDTNGGLFTVCCFGGGGRSARLFRTQPGFVSAVEITAYPAGGLLPTFHFPESIVNVTGPSYVLITRNCTPGAGGCPAADGGVFLTTNIDAAPPVWTELGNATEPPSNLLCGVYVSVNAGGTPTFFAQTGSCNSTSTADRLFRFTGTNPAGLWTEVFLPSGGFGVVAVHPSDPNRLLASGLTTAGGGMFASSDGGATWTALTVLDALMDGGGDFPFKNLRGPVFFTGFSGYWQPSMVAFDPNSNFEIAGAADAGIFLSADSGTTWSLISDPRTSDVSGTPHLPRPHFAYFDTEPGTTPVVYVGTQGRGIWRIRLEAIFADGFETGDTSRWSNTVP